MKMVFKTLVFVVCCVFVSCELLSEVFVDKQWEEFKLVHKKKYSMKEEIKRKSIWLKNIDLIIKHNIEADNGLHSYRLEINKFADMTSEDMKCVDRPGELEEEGMVNVSTFIPPNNMELPDTVDWSKKGYVTHVKNQGDCGSCWAFSVTGGLEGQHFKKTGKLVSLSEQNLVDCDTANNGCNGGNRGKAYQYIANNNGINTEKSYPYVAKEQTCNFSRSEVGATCKSFSRIPVGDELALQKAVASVGPISVGIRLVKEFSLYKEGVFDHKSCQSNERHALLIVGYGVFNGKDYWLVKNSWGQDWGMMDGYIMMSRNQNSQCGIADSALYPIVDGMPSSDCVFTSSNSRFVTVLLLIYYFIAQI